MSDYPDRPGWKEDGTSREAAEAMAGRAGTLRAAVYNFICRNPRHTADEIAEALGESVLAVRPRVSELRVAGLITNDGRGRNASGNSAHLWVVRGWCNGHRNGSRSNHERRVML